MNYPIYFNFPIEILKKPFSFENGKLVYNVREACDDILNYCCYAFTLNRIGRTDHLVKEAGQYYNVRFSSDSFQRGKQIYDWIPVNSPKAGITKNILFDFYQNFKTEFEKETFLAFCGLRSIIQKQQYCKITKNYLVARMAGLPKSNDASKAPKEIRKYLTRYHFDKVRDELIQNWGLKAYGQHTNGLYVSFQLTYEELGKKAELNKKKNKVIQARISRKMKNKEINKLVEMELQSKDAPHHNNTIEAPLIKTRYTS